MEIRLKNFLAQIFDSTFSRKFKCYKNNYQSLLTNMVRSRRQHKIVGKFRIYFNFSHFRFPFFLEGYLYPSFLYTLVYLFYILKISPEFGYIPLISKSTMNGFFKTFHLRHKKKTFFNCQKTDFSSFFLRQIVAFPKKNETGKNRVVYSKTYYYNYTLPCYTIISE